jgi:hypothetical protein
MVRNETKASTPLPTKIRAPWVTTWGNTERQRCKTAPWASFSRIEAPPLPTGGWRRQGQGKQSPKFGLEGKPGGQAPPPRAGGRAGGAPAGRRGPGMAPWAGATSALALSPPQRCPPPPPRNGHWDRIALVGMDRGRTLSLGRSRLAPGIQSGSPLPVSSSPSCVPHPLAGPEVRPPSGAGAERVD